MKHALYASLRSIAVAAHKPILAKLQRSIGRTLFVAALAGSLAHTPAQAQSCLALQSEKVIVMGDIARLLADHPGTHVVVGLCGAAAIDDYQRKGDPGSATGTFAVCAGIGCMMAGFSNCIDVATRWALLTLRVKEIEKQQRAYSPPC